MSTRLIFSLNTGRCGSGYLALILRTIPGVDARHEPKPDFVDVFRKCIGDRKVYREWLLREKLSYMDALQGSVYVETSHLFCQGFVEPMLDLGVPFDVIILRRPHREVALSMWRKPETPNRTPLGWRYRLQPSDPDTILHTEFPEWSKWTDYQLCYWHCLEIDARIRKYIPMLLDAGALVAETSLDEITTQDGFSKLVETLGLSDFSPEAYTNVGVFNQTVGELKNAFPDGNLDEQEREIRERWRTLIHT